MQWFVQSDSRFCLVFGGERGGKSLLISYLAGLSMRPDRGGEYWVVGPDYRQARAEFLYLYQAFADADMVEGSASMPTSEVAPWSFVTKWGATWKTRSSIDIAKLASFRVEGAIMAEAGQQPYEVFLKLMGRVSETNGFLLLSGTIEKGQAWYTDMFKRWQGENPLQARSFSLPTWSNTVVYPGGREDPKIKELEAEFPHDLFMERFGAVPRKLHGVVIPEFDYAKHVKHLVPDPKLPVEIWVDPGQHCYAVLFVQKYGLVTHVLDRIYARNRIVQDVIPEAMANPLWKLIKPEHAGVIDNAGKQHHANRSQVELWQEIGHVSLRSQYVPLKTTIETVRFRLRDVNPLHQPLVLFNDHMTSAKSPDGLALDVLAEFELWKWPDRISDADSNKPINPVDRNNDAIKALGYGLVDHYGAYVERPLTPPPVRRAYWGVPASL